LPGLYPAKAAAVDVFGASLYEPCGQIDQIGNIFGATATNRDTRGCHDKIRELALQAEGAPRSRKGYLLLNPWERNARLCMITFIALTKGVILSST